MRNKQMMQSQLAKDSVRGSDAEGPRAETPEALLERISDIVQTGEPSDKLQGLIDQVLEWVEREDIHVQDEVVFFILGLFYKDYPARKQQVHAIRRLLVERKDLMLIAKTSFGKSMMLQALSAIRPSSIMIVIIPLTVIGRE